MAARTRTGTETLTISALNVREVMALIGQEIATICRAMREVARDFDPDSALVQVSLLALNDVAATIHLQFYTEDRQLVREYAYVIADQPLQPSGPPPSQPPLGAVPENVRMRLAVTPNGSISKEVRDDWFRRLGWVEAEPLALPADASYQTYGTFASGGYGVQRQLLVNPRFDRPVALVSSQSRRKEF